MDTPIGYATTLWPLVAYFAAAIVLVSTMLALSSILGQRHRGRATGEPYESGIVSTGSARVRLSADFYLIAMFFVIFDLEAVFIYYLRLVAAMYMQPPREEVSVVASSLSLAGSLVLAALMLLLVWLGVYPAPFIDMIQATAARFI